MYPVQILGLIGQDETGTALTNLAYYNIKIDCNFVALILHPTITKLRGRLVITNYYAWSLEEDFQERWNVLSCLRRIRSGSEKNFGALVLSDYGKGEDIKDVQKMIPNCTPSERTGWSGARKSIPPIDTKRHGRRWTG